MDQKIARRPLLISFSGVDGSGKSTQIENLRTAFHSAGMTTSLLAFWDNVVVGVKYREGFVHKVYKSEPASVRPASP
jgi:thymidylate kinase